MKKNRPLVHFVGIGGIGMSALARWFLVQKWAVSGSDLSPSIITRSLAKDGCRVKIGHSASFISPETELVIYNQAIPKDNPELLRARKLNIHRVSYPEAIGALTENYKTITVSGAHGKSTTSALASLVLMRGALDPTVIIGTNLREFGNANFHKGQKNGFLILEADEWRASFLHYLPSIAIITNIDKEHLDYYKNFSRIKEAFLRFIARIKKGGALIFNADDPQIKILERRIRKIARKKNLDLIPYSIRSPKIPAKKIKSVLKIPGEHNLSNALAAYTLGHMLKISESKILRALGSYRGAWRRMEFKGRYNGALVFDDYAHHPTEIEATIKGFKEKFPRKKILCIFQPHQAKRLANLFPEFTAAFDEADECLILPSYEVAGRDKDLKRHNAEELVRVIQKKNQKKLIFYLKDIQSLKKAIRILSPSSSPLSNKVIIMMGAGDIFEHTKTIVDR